MRPPLRSSGHRPHGGSMRPSHRPVGHRPHGPSMNPKRPTINVKTPYRASWVPTVNRNNPHVNRKLSTGRRNFLTANRKIPTASRKFTTGSTKNHTADMGRKKLSKDETSDILKKFITEIENLKDSKVKIIRCDNGGKFRNKVMNDFYSQKGIKRVFSNARTPQQNGVAERRNRTLIEAARTMLADAKLPVTFWLKQLTLLVMFKIGS
uniref:Putative ribonuclease H-like domain-containing protein n=1 Tax=Tanacetum cinerariifolium TaxID=118510 RepID=A0A699KZ57_TANCI|nr:putative ribonuclease H-like domain-containing protein [Tanacetum cinerariifolium]